MTDRHQHHKSLLAPLRAALYEGGEQKLDQVGWPQRRLSYPFGYPVGDMLPRSFMGVCLSRFMQHGRMWSAVNLS